MKTTGASGDLPAPRELSALRRGVLGFGRVRLRSLPWRETRDPWAVLVSEVMLQQTQAARVVGPYRRFLRSFPTAGACAGAPLAEVVRAWDGLGYNRRACHLHAAAATLTARHGGAVPADLDALRSLPGVGPYTARAVLAFAFERDVAVVDVNVARVLARAVLGRPLGPAQRQPIADAIRPRRQAWLWNQSLVELGAVVCTARAPCCARCPLARACRWRAAGRPAPDPAATPRRQGTFEGSHRQGRGRLVAALRRGPVSPRHIADACGWPDDPARARRVADSLVSDGLARRRARGVLTLP